MANLVQTSCILPTRHTLFSGLSVRELFAVFGFQEYETAVAQYFLRPSCLPHLTHAPASVPELPHFATGYEAYVAAKVLGSTVSVADLVNEV
jgi:hypothetical protein